MRPWLDQFLFAPIAVRPALVFRGLVALMTVLTFWNQALPLVPAVRAVPGLEWLLTQLLMTPPFRWVLVAALILFSLGWHSRVLGIVLAVVLLPQCGVWGGIQSRYLIWFALLATSCFRETRHRTSPRSYRRSHPPRRQVLNLDN